MRTHLPRSTAANRTRSQSCAPTCHRLASSRASCRRSRRCRSMLRRPAICPARTCYADEERFHGAARLMQKGIAFRGIDSLIANAAGQMVTIGFIGGEPFLNRALLRQCVDYARASAGRAGIAVRFSVTTNATMLQEEDLRLLRENRFAVNISIDGGPSRNRHRRLRSGRESAAAAVSGIAPLL